MLDDSEIAALSFWLIVISVQVGTLAIILYTRDPRCLWRTRNTIEWTGKGFESENVAERVAQVRRDFVGALHSRPHPRFHSRSLLRAASQVVRASSYWQHASITETSEEPFDKA